MLYLKSILRYLPFLGVLIALIWYYRFYSDILPQVGKGSDAAGAGMAKGLMELAFYASFGLYLSILLAALVLFFIENRFPRLQTALNLSLLLPLFWFGFAKLKELADASHKRSTEAESYARWRSLAQTRSFVDSKDRFRFRYASVAKGTFNTSYFPTIELVVSDDSASLLTLKSNPVGDASLLGKVSALDTRTTDAPSSIALQTAIEERTLSPCRIEVVRTHPFKQFMADPFIVYRLPSHIENRSCREAYARSERNSNPKLGEYFHFGHHDIFFVTNSSKPSLALEIVLDPHTLLLLGPLELNQSLASKTDWYETIEF